jgi:hypothetical protein
MKFTLKYANNTTRTVELDDAILLKLAAEKAEWDDANERQKAKSMPVTLTAQAVI